MIAPEPYFYACMKVMFHATCHVRRKVREGLLNREELLDLMDAIHNIPGLVQHWEHCDLARLRGYLKTFEDNWHGLHGLDLCTLFDAALGAHQQSDAA